MCRFFGRRPGRGDATHPCIRLPPRGRRSQHASASRARQARNRGAPA